jgi:hypothetical protein
MDAHRIRGDGMTAIGFFMFSIGAVVCLCFEQQYDYRGRDIVMAIFGWLYLIGGFITLCGFSLFLWEHLP